MLSKTQVDVRYLPTGRMDPYDLEERFLSWLGEAELSAFRRLVRLDDRRDYLAAHALVRICVAPMLARDPSRVEIRYESNGRPYVGGESIAFSLSHSSEMVACAYLPGPNSTTVSVGVDVEPITARSHMADVARILLCDSETAWIESCSDADFEMLRLWTAKEAVLKARGTGFQTSSGGSPFLSVVCRKPVVLDNEESQRSQYKSADGARIENLVVEGSHVLSVATIGPTGAQTDVRIAMSDPIL